jgi:DNA-directed RNA polymerase specialized sigma24 family protein
MNETEPTPIETVTLWIEQLKEGDAKAVENLWGRYFAQLVELARSRLEGSPRAAADEEDVALSAFKSFCFGARRGQFPGLRDRDSLWSLLVGITAHKCVDQIRHENREKRRVSGYSSATGFSRRGDEPLSWIRSEQPTPEFAALVAEQFELLLVRLNDANDPDLIQIALAKMDGDSTTEIAAKFSCVPRTVERKLIVIRRLWERECP